MEMHFTQNGVDGIQATGKPFWVTDKMNPNLFLYVGASGTKIWYVGFRKKGANYKKHKLGMHGVYKLKEILSLKGDFLNRLGKGEEPDKKIEILRFEDFIEKYYATWVVPNRKTGKETMAILRSQFRFLFNVPIDALDLLKLEEWRTWCQSDKDKEKDKDGNPKPKKPKKASTINRHITALQAALNWAVDHNLIDSNPLISLKSLQERDSKNARVRYLSVDELQRLMAAINEREVRIRAARVSHNEWLVERGKEPLPLIDCKFADYLKPLVLLALNLGVRRGNLFSLKWGNIDFSNETIYLPADTTKPGKDLQVYMNETVIDILKAWYQQSVDTSPEAWAFPSAKRKDEHMVSVRCSWKGVLREAKIENFRFHDLRHDYASQLVMQRVDLNVVRELLGHADIKTTLRYAHLADNIKKEAVRRLDERSRTVL